MPDVPTGFGPCGARIAAPPANALRFPRPARSQIRVMATTGGLSIPIPPMRQGIGSCGMNSTGMALATLFPGFLPSVVGSYYFGRVESGLPTNQDAGVFPESVAQLLMRSGYGSVATHHNDEARFTERPGVEYQQEAKDHRALNVYRATSSAQVKAALAGSFPVVIAAVLRESFGLLRSDGLWRKPAGGEVAGHMMLVYRYDDFREPGPGYAQGCFDVLQSWGPWGEAVTAHPQYHRSSFRLPYRVMDGDEDFIYDVLVIEGLDKEAGR